MTQNKQPKISIITVCFNESQESIAHTFNSISSQSYANVEWVVIDGGSGPDTIKAINDHLDKIDIFVSEPDNGIYDAMNKGLSRSTGDFVNFMNVGDVFVSADTLAELVKVIDAKPDHDCYYGDVIRVGSDNVKRLARLMRKPGRFQLFTSSICHQTIFCNRQLFDQVGVFDLRYPVMADWHWIQRTIEVDARWLHTGMVICEYDCGGISSDRVRFRADYDRIIKDRYSVLERVFYRIGWKLLRIYQRNRS